MSTRERWSRGVTVGGYVAMLAGAIDPLEGSLLILPGSALVALGAFLAQTERRRLVRRLWVFGLIALGVGAMLALSAVGGFGGHSGRSAWWSLTILPYLMGWSLGIWGWEHPRWVPWGGMAVGLWYLVLSAMILARSNPSRPSFPAALITIGVFGAVTIAGSSWRLRRRAAAAQPGNP